MCVCKFLLLSVSAVDYKCVYVYTYSLTIPPPTKKFTPTCKQTLYRTKEITKQYSLLHTYTIPN